MKLCFLLHSIWITVQSFGDEKSGDGDLFRASIGYSAFSYFRFNPFMSGGPATFSSVILFIFNQPINCTPLYIIPCDIHFMMNCWWSSDFDFEDVCIFIIFILFSRNYPSQPSIMAAWAPSSTSILTISPLPLEQARCTALRPFLSSAFTSMSVRNRLALERYRELTKHCQRHNGPEGWVHLAKVTLRSNPKFKHKSWSHSIFRISTIKS